MKRVPKAGDLSGSLLVAHPMMADPNFRHTILYLSHHSAEDGALGFILNRPLGQSAGDLEVGELLEHISNVPIFEGGPVQRNQVIVASLEWDTASDACKFKPLQKPEGELELPAGHDDKLRVFLGYAGWSRNQLEKEIALNSWLVVKPHPELLRADADDTTWRLIMNSLGPMYRVLADSPDDVSRN
ncbi:MAG: YqgE/AlgH family protein [Chthoniobacterales bacterium]|jgi:putative transcriptional regulator|nr:YqgE/AlgH family protein [Chthoniobacterales bacterium]